MIRRNQALNSAFSLNRKQALLSASLFGLALVLGAAALMPPNTSVVRERPKAVATAPLMSSAAPSALAAPLAASAAPAPRRVYPFSVVPGGVASQQELARVVIEDRLVAEHYAHFNIDAARIVRVDKPRAVYVSYRKDGKIYWTARKLMLAEGETLLTDGVHELRTRCGNRISDVPRKPVAADEPSTEVFDAAVESDDSALQMISAEDLYEPDAAGPAFQLMTFDDSGLMPGTQANRARRGFGGSTLGAGGLGASGASFGQGTGMTRPRSSTPPQSGFPLATEAGGEPGDTDAGGPRGPGTPPGGTDAPGEPGVPAGPTPPRFAGPGDPKLVRDPGPIKRELSDPGVPGLPGAPGNPLAVLPPAPQAGEEGRVPEPATLALMLGALAMLAVARRRPRAARP